MDFYDQNVFNQNFTKKLTTFCENRCAVMAAILVKKDNSTVEVIYKVFRSALFTGRKYSLIWCVCVCHC